MNIVIDYNCEDHEILKKYAKLVYKTGMVEKAQSDEFAVEVLKTYIKTLTKIMNMPQNLKECGVDKNEFDNVKSIIAENALKDGCTQANRREITKIWYGKTDSISVLT